ncbi:MAG: DUF1579 domain-containing protein [Planctomycetota bacterium]|nr:DUF1579 domain-containing protein [Planctomycetaceae bacterium]MDQ3329545.1 DUF1579 domain-containing protein [Planctomycetota bacterium]
MLRTGILSVVACLLATGLSQGQEFPKPGPEHKELQEMVGTWETVMEINGQKSKGTAVYKSICGGMFVASDFDGEFFGQKFTGHGIDGYDQNKKEFVSVWVDSMTSSPMELRGKYEDKVLVMTGEAAGPDGSMQKVKTTTTMKDKDHMTFKFHMVDGGDQPMFTIEYSRKK